MAADFRDEGVPLIRVSGVGGESVTLQGCNFLDPSMVSSRWDHFRLRRGDYLISASASMGIVSKVDQPAVGAVPYTGLIIFRPQGRTDMEFVRWFLQSKSFMDQIDRLKTGTAIQHFGPTHLDQVYAPDLSPEDQLVVGGYLSHARRRTLRAQAALEAQCALLAEQRQALVTSAVTGELLVEGASC